MQETSRQMMALLSGAWVAQTIFIAAKLGIADLLRDGPKSPAELATAAGTDATALYRVMRALSSIGIFADGDGDMFALTPLAELLRSDVPGSLRPYAIMNGERWVWRSWGDIEFSVRTGQPAFEHVFGAKLFDYYNAHPDASRVSVAALNSLSAADNAAVLGAYGFPDAGTVIDIGGGEGSLLAAVLAARHGLRGVLFERPEVASSARSPLGAAGMLDRCATVAGDFFSDPLPTGDIYLLKKVVHDWDDEAARVILANCRAAMSSSSRLLLAELILPDGSTPSAAKWLDLLMLVYSGGRERTEAEHRSLLASAGLAIERVIPTAAAISLIEARRI